MHHSNMRCSKHSIPQSAFRNVRARKVYLLLIALITPVLSRMPQSQIRFPEYEGLTSSYYIPYTLLQVKHKLTFLTFNPGPPHLIILTALFPLTSPNDSEHNNQLFSSVKSLNSTFTIINSLLNAKNTILYKSGFNAHPQKHLVFKGVITREINHHDKIWDSSSL